MTAFFLESPIAVAGLGLFLAAIAVIVWTQVDDRKTQRLALASAAIVLLSTALLTAVSIYFETDRERIEATLHSVAQALEKNDLQTVYSYIHPNAVEGLQRAKAELPRYHFNDVRVTRVKEIKVNNKTQPRTAIAEFNVVVDVNLGVSKGRAARFVRIYFMERDGRWLAQDYEHMEPTAGFRQTP